MVVAAYPFLCFMGFRKVLKRTVMFHPKELAGGLDYKEGVYLVREKGKLYALSARCTHLGCTVSYDPLAGQFRCPCHGSVYGLSGRREAGPAQRDLERLPIQETRPGEILVTLHL